MGHSISTAAVVGFATVLLIIMAILILVADDRTKNITGYSGNNDLKAAHDKLIWAQVLAWIAAGLAFLLLLGYLALHFLETSEWIHLILWILLFAVLIVSLIFLGMALSDIDKAKVSDDKGAAGYGWGAIILGGISFIILLVSGGWRIAHKSWENSQPNPQYYMAANADPMAPSSNEPPEFPSQTVSTQSVGNQPQIQVTTSGTAVAPM